jgi:hypothetical protein
MLSHVKRVCQAEQPVADQLAAPSRNYLLVCGFGRNSDPKWSDHQNTESAMLWTVILIILILMLLGALPTWPYSSGWGYYPSGGLGLILVIILLVIALGR